ncbi:MAG: hypothetical protein OEV76_04175, partial [Anaerolineae bacterium]|nr:hypothetical protein [Anaerolineae bacterium]
VLGDGDQDVRRAVSFAVRMGARGDPKAVADFIERQADRTDPESIWVLCDAIRSMTKEFLPQFKRFLPVYRSWIGSVDARSERSVTSAIRALESA